MSDNMNLYRLAAEELKRFFDSVNNHYNISEEVNPIEHIKYRIKKYDSIKHKLERKGYETTLENINEHIKDVVGFRIVCSFLSDLDELKNIISSLEENGIKITEIKDYITTPKKDSGYSSYHILVKVPVNYKDQVYYVNAEIQLRTIAMDMSASLEHKLCYKKEGYADSLRIMANKATGFCREVDEQLDNIVKSIDNNSVVVSNDILDDNSFVYPFMSGTSFNLLKLKYEEALKFVTNEFIKLKNYYDIEEKLNPIEHIKSRIKNNNEIVRKLVEKDRIVNIDNVDKYVNDLAGVRIVCSFLDDVEELKKFIYENSIQYSTNIDTKKFFDIVEEKDYITNPKESGYRGYHFLVRVPVYTLSGVEFVKVEIQLRTVAMEMWASLEEKIAYHKEIDENIVNELHRISSVTSVMDDNFNAMYNNSKKQNNVNIKKLVRK